MQPEKTDCHRIEIPSTMLAIRKGFRWFAGIWCVIAVLFTVFGLVKLITQGPTTETIDLLIALPFIAAAASIFWFAPDRMIRFYQRRLAAAMDNPDLEVHRVKAVTPGGSFEQVEIRSKKKEPFCTPDRNGQIILDSTRRPLRLIFGGIFLGIVLLIGLAIWSLEDEIGFLEYFFVMGAGTYALISMGFVYEVVIHPRKGLVDRKAGWFFILWQQRYSLEEFQQILVESTFYKSRHDPLQDRYRSQDHKFKVDLAGSRRLNLRVFDNLGDARSLAAELAEHLGLPVVEKAEVRY